MANTKLQTKPSFFPDMPASLDGKAHWAGRTFGVRFTDTGAKGSDSYITTGIFPAPQSSQRGDTDLIKAMTVIFDLDIVDLYNNDGFLKRALEVFAQQGVEIVYSTNATKKTAFDLPSFSAEPLNDANAERSRKADRKHIVKAFLTSLPQADLVAMVEGEVHLTSRSSRSISVSLSRSPTQVVALTSTMLSLRLRVGPQPDSSCFLKTSVMISSPTSQSGRATISRSTLMWAVSLTRPLTISAVTLAPV